MSIYTRTGNPIDILEVIMGELVRCRLPMGGTRLVSLSDLRADGGQPEIDAAVTRVSAVYGDE